MISEVYKPSGINIWDDPRKAISSGQFVRLSAVRAETSTTYLSESDRREESRNGSDTDYTCIVIEIFQRINGQVNGKETLWESYDTSDEQSTSIENEDAVLQQLVSSVVIRRIETHNRFIEQRTEWENVWDNMYVRRLYDMT